jgi:hypothetical protein
VIDLFLKRAWLQGAPKRPDGNLPLRGYKASIWEGYENIPATPHVLIVCPATKQCGGIVCYHAVDIANLV